MSTDKLNLNHLETFFSVFQTGSYTKSSKELGCTPSNVRQKVQRFQDIVGTELFKNKRKCLYPTNEATRIYNQLYPSFRDLEVQASSLTNQKLKNNLNILTTTGSSLTLLVQAIHDYSKSGEEINCSIHTTEDPDLKNNPAYDIAFLPQHLGCGDYCKVPLIKIPTKLYASKEYLDIYGTPQSPKELDTHKIISFYHSSDQYRGDIDWPLRIGRPPSDPRTSSLVINNSLGIGSAVALGMGIAALAWNHPFIDQFNLVPILPDEIGPAVTVYFYYSPALGNSTFVKYMLENVPKLNTA
jgi:DNA-binding transcriptional LysR family regulator